MKNKATILFLNHTWGIIMTLIGYAARLVFLCKGVKGISRGFVKVYKVGIGWGGVSLGTTVIVAHDSGEYTISHEVGHGIQNAMYGVLFPFIVAIPSFIRYHYRERLYRKGIRPKTSYDAIWFEGQATKLGRKYFKGE